jgi:hypothetical protein
VDALGIPLECLELTTPEILYLRQPFLNRLERSGVHPVYPDPCVVFDAVLGDEAGSA